MSRGKKAEMFDTPAVIIGLTGAAFLIGSLAPIALESRERPASAIVSGKGDRLPAPTSAGVQPATVSTIEVVGISQAAVVFKDRDAKNVDLPVVTIKEQPSAPAVPMVQRPEPKREGGDPATVQPPRAKPVGCEAPVSALARSEASRTPALCLAGLLSRSNS